MRSLKASLQPETISPGEVVSCFSRNILPSYAYYRSVTLNVALRLLQSYWLTLP